MRPRFLGCAVLCVALSAGCDKNDQPFLPLDRLCNELATDICTARAGCCGLEDRAACQQREAQACAPLKQQLEAEDARSYDATEAVILRANARVGTDECGPRPAVASFFEGGLALGVTCARDAQCASGSCGGAPRACVDPLALPLCEGP